METDKRMTMEAALEMIRQMKKVFPVVRLLDGKQLSNERLPELRGISGEPCVCRQLWNDRLQCKNCVVRRAFREKKQIGKLEMVSSDLYHVTGKYMEIDGKPYVMELLNRLEDDELLISADQKILISGLTDYDTKLYKDALTGVYNRRYYEEKIRSLTEHFGVAMLDLDDFKLYNDTYGHLAGDRALDTTVKVVRSCIRKVDILIRYGGDEFLLVLPDIDKDTFRDRLRQIQEEIHNARVPGYPQLRLSVSIGGVMTEDETVEQAVNRADRFMYQAKQYKNMVVTEHDHGKGGHSSVMSDISREMQGREKILIIDDSGMNRMVLREILKSDYDILEAADGQEGLNILERFRTDIALVLLDIVMPKMDGFGVLEHMNRDTSMKEIPVIMISGEDSDSFVRRAYDMGVSDYIKRPFDFQVVYRRVRNTITLYAKQRRLLSLVTNQIYEKEKNNRMMIGILSQIMEFRNGESGIHVLHINVITAMLLEKLVRKSDAYDLSWPERLMITTASALHDIGKIGIDDKILNKPGALTDEEYEITKKHTLIGAEILDNLDIYRTEPLVRIASDICRWHHERYDGKGYPDGLKGEQIPISAQVVSLADVYDALISGRSYKKGYSHEEALEMIRKGYCGAFNPVLLECLEEISGDIKNELQASVGEAVCIQSGSQLRKELHKYHETKDHLFNKISREMRFEQQNI